MTYVPISVERADRYKVTVEQYSQYQRDGFLKVNSLVTPEDIQRLSSWADDMLYGRIPIPGIDPVEPDMPLDQLLKRFSRIHMLHRSHETAEWGLLHPAVLDVLEALIGPDVLALQSMNFFNPPGRGGQGWHQDSYYIPTYPDTLIGVWIAIDAADEENGCLWVVPGSNHEPIYPPTEGAAGSVHATGAFDGLFAVHNVSDLDDEVNTLSQVVGKYPAPIPVEMQSGDVLFFHGHLLHRSHPNRSADRFRRSYTCHYSNARSWVPWNHGAPFEGEAANELHILARGRTHLPYAKPIYGTMVEHSQDVATSAGNPVRMMGTKDGDMVGME